MLNMNEEQLFQEWFKNEWKFGSSTDESKARRAWTACRNVKEMPKDLEDLRIDPQRAGARGTGIYIRAVDLNGKWTTVDISEIDSKSLLTWLRSRGGKNEYAENTVGLLLGHNSLTDVEND